MEQPPPKSNLQSAPSADSQSQANVKISEPERMQQEFEELLERIPKPAHFLLSYSPSRPEDWTNYTYLIVLMSEQIDLSNPEGLIYVRRFAVATVESIHLAHLREEILANEQRSILRGQIEEGLIWERRPDHEIGLSAALMTKEYFERYSSWRELTDRFPNVSRRYQIQAAAFQARLLDISRIELMIKNCEQRQDRALKRLEAFRKPDAERLRELAHSLEKSEIKPPVDSEIVVPPKS
jgi:hypothetical protein